MASEVLKVSHTAGVTNSESVLLNGVNGHTYTILSITVCETAGNAETFDLYLDDGGGSDADNPYTLAETTIPPLVTLVLEDNLSFDSNIFSLKIDTSTTAEITVIIK